MTTIRHHIRAKLIWLAVAPVIGAGVWQYKSIETTQHRLICHIHVVRDSTRAQPETISVCVIEDRR